MIAVSYILQDIMFTFIQGPRVHPIPPATLAAAPARKETSTGADVYLYDMYMYIYVWKKSVTVALKTIEKQWNTYISSKFHLSIIFVGAIVALGGLKGVINRHNHNSNSYHKFVQPRLYNHWFVELHVPSRDNTKNPLSIMTDR